MRIDRVCSRFRIINSLNLCVRRCLLDGEFWKWKEVSWDDVLRRRNLRFSTEEFLSKLRPHRWLDQFLRLKKLGMQNEYKCDSVARQMNILRFRPHFKTLFSSNFFVNRIELNLLVTDACWSENPRRTIQYAQNDYG